MVKHLQSLSRHRKEEGGKIGSSIKVESHALAGDEQPQQILDIKEQNLSFRLQK